MNKNTLHVKILYVEVFEVKLEIEVYLNDYNYNIQFQDLEKQVMCCIMSNMWNHWATGL